MSLKSPKTLAGLPIRACVGRTAVMGVLNVTPDSFFDGGAYATTGDAVERARRMADEGADIIDVGGESTRPAAEPVPADVEISRVAPVIERATGLGVPISIDTRNAHVARAALDAGASCVNDVSGGTWDGQMLPLVADRGVPIVLMHMRGDPASMDRMTGYADVVAEVGAELLERVRAAVDAGVDRARIFIDPGLGFAKTAEQSLEVLKRIDDIRAIGLPVVVGPSRKRFVGHVVGGDAGDRLEGTLAAVAWCAMHGVDVVRVHDVKEARRVVEMIGALSS